MAWAHGLLVLALLAALDQPRAGEAPTPVAVPPLKPAPEALVPSGTLRALEAPTAVKATRSVAAFWLDENPVTNEEFLRFVSLHPRYRKGQISALFADAGYLAHWAAPLELGKNAAATAARGASELVRGQNVLSLARQAYSDGARVGIRSERQ